MQNGYRGKTRG